jgi:hypothetical protein
VAQKAVAAAEWRSRAFIDRLLSLAASAGDDRAVSVAGQAGAVNGRLTNCGPA